MRAALSRARAHRDGASGGGPPRIEGGTDDGQGADDRGPDDSARAGRAPARRAEREPSTAAQCQDLGGDAVRTGDDTVQGGAARVGGERHGDGGGGGCRCDGSDLAGGCGLELGERPPGGVRSRPDAFDRGDGGGEFTEHALFRVVVRSGATFWGLRLRDGGLIINVARGRKWKRIRVTDGAAFDPARSDLEIAPRAGPPGPSEWIRVESLDNTVFVRCPRTRSAAPDSGTRWSTRAFIRSAESVHIERARSNSDQEAPRTSPERAAVSTANSSVRRGAA